MDKLVAQYTQAPHQNEFYSEQEQHDLTESLPPISLKFNLPPVDNVRLSPLEGLQWLIAMAPGNKQTPMLPRVCTRPPLDPPSPICHTTT